jgi:flagellar biosynthesis anti-sigma factor FlgM
MRNQAQKKKPAPPQRRSRDSIVESGYVAIAPPATDAEVEIDWVKVEMLRAAIEGGSYEIDPRAIAEAMIDRGRSSR